MRLLELTSGLFSVRGVTVVQRSEDPAGGRMTLATVLRRLICAAFLVLFVCASAPSVVRALAGPFPNRVDPFHSSNAYLQAVTGSPNASQRIIDVMDSLPREKPLLIFEREKDSVSSLLGMSLAYLAWPRDVRFETADGGHCDRQLAKIAPNSVGGIAFCDLPAPSWIPGGMRLGRNGKLIAFADESGKR